MTSSAKEFRAKYKLENNNNDNNKNKISKGKKALVAGAIATSLFASTLTGCGKGKDVKNIAIGMNMQEPTKENGDAYEEKEKEKIKNVINTKKEFITKTLSEYKEVHPNREMTGKDIKIIKTKLYLWENNNKYYVDNEKDIIKGCESIKRKKGDYDLIVVDSKYNRVLYTISRIDKKPKETYLYGYYDEEKDRRYLNDISYGSVISSEYSEEQCFNGANSLLEYQNNIDIYGKWETYYNRENNSIKYYIVGENER